MDPEDLMRALKDAQRRLADYHNVLLAVRDYLEMRAGQDREAAALKVKVKAVLAD